MRRARAAYHDPSRLLAGEDLFRHPVGDLAGRDVLAARALGDGEDGVVDGERLPPRALGVVAGVFAGDVDQAAGVDRVIGRVEDAARVEGAADLGAGELVVGGAGDRAALEVGDARFR